MKNVADTVLEQKIMRVGEPDIIRHGEVWTSEHKYDQEFVELMNMAQL